MIRTRKTSLLQHLFQLATGFSWFARETGIQVAIPELWGNIFVGRQKEGVSLNRISIGYTGWAMERMPMSDATVPIMNDGIKWLGYVPKKRILWNLGFYKDWVSEGQAFSTYSSQAVGRLASSSGRLKQ